MLGTMGFLVWALPVAGNREPMLPIPIRLVRISGWLALALGAVWLALLSAEMSNASSVDRFLEALPVVATQTHYGRFMMLRGGLLLVAVLSAGRSHNRLYKAILLGI